MAKHGIKHFAENSKSPSIKQTGSKSRPGTLLGLFDTVVFGLLVLIKAHARLSY